MAGSETYLWAPAPGTTEISGEASPPAHGPRPPVKWGARDNQSYVNVISFGFFASAILISMFLVKAIFESLLRPRSTLQPVLPASEEVSRRGAILPARAQPHSRTIKSDCVQLNVAAQGIPVLMPGQDTPSFIARPAPVPATCNHSSISVPEKTFPGHFGS